MTKRKTKSTTRASASKTSVAKSPTVPTAAASPLIVLGFDEHRKPCGARFVDAKPDLVAKAADFMDLQVHKVTSPEVAEIAKKLPAGRLYANGRGFVPNIRQELYSDLVVMLAAEPQQGALRAGDEKAALPAARGLPKNWDEIETGHLVIAQESAAYGWWPAIVIERTGDMLTLRYRDYPKLPKFFRHRSAVALMSAATA
jgi:hypothetical protein